MLQVLLFGLSVTLTLAQTPATPLWPNTFWQVFNETKVSPTTGTNYDFGTYYYDFTVPAFRINRSNGRYDAVCGGGPHSTVNTPCDQYVIGGNRFVYFPEFNDCYYCCNSTEGCSILKPTWMSTAVYVDTEVHDGVLTYKWSIAGTPQRYVYETVGNVPLNRVTISIIEEPAEFFDFSSKRNTVIPAGTFNLPSTCSLNKLAQWGFCAQLNPANNVETVE